MPIVLIFPCRHNQYRYVLHLNRRRECNQFCEEHNRVIKGEMLTGKLALVFCDNGARFLSPNSWNLPLKLSHTRMLAKPHADNFSHDTEDH